MIVAIFGIAGDAAEPCDSEYEKDDPDAEHDRHRRLQA